MPSTHKKTGAGISPPLLPRTAAHFKISSSLRGVIPLEPAKLCPIKTESTNEKYTFRVWLLRLGLIGDEFKTARKHLLDHLEGCIAWKDPAQAERQKERLREKREAEKIQAEEAEQQPTEEIVLEAEDEESPAFTMSM
jgi:hypothetical protein